MTRRVGRDAFLRQNGIERRDGEAALRAWRGPLLVVCGADDRLTPPADHRDIAGLVPGARLEILEGCGHMAPMERPDAVSAAFRGWLAAPPGTGGGAAG